MAITESESSKSMLKAFKAYSSIHLTTHYEKYYIIHGTSPITLQSSAPAEPQCHTLNSHHSLHVKSHVLP